jgi:hypothetical protein
MIRQLIITSEALSIILRQDTAHEVIENGLPDRVKVVKSEINSRGDFVLDVEHESFNEDDGPIVPILRALECRPK